MPKEFNIKNNITDITGVYVPFWLYSYKFKVNINSGKYDKSIEKKYAIIDFNLIPYDANKHLDNKLTSSIEPCNYEELVDFNSSYLSGFIAQKYDIDEKEGLEFTQERANTTIHETFKNKNSKEYVDGIFMITKELKETNKYYALLPIWLLNIKYKDKIYHLAVNGQTGKVSGNLPIDKEKLTLVALIIFLIVFILLTIICVFLIWRGLI